MNKFVGVFLNVILLIFSIITMISSENNFRENLLIIIIVMFGFNCLLFIIYILGNFLEPIINNKLNKIKLEKYSLFDWLGDSNNRFRDFYNVLKNEKNVYDKEFNDNYDKLLEIIRNQFPTKEELMKLQTVLEVNNSSPRIHLIKNATITLLIAGLTPSLLQIINMFISDNEINELIMLSSVGLFLLLWFLLLYFIEFISKKSDGTDYLLKIVQMLLENDDFYK